MPPSPGGWLLAGLDRTVSILRGKGLLRKRIVEPLFFAALADGKRRALNT